MIFPRGRLNAPTPATSQILKRCTLGRSIVFDEGDPAARAAPAKRILVDVDGGARLRGRFDQAPERLGDVNAAVSSGGDWGSGAWPREADAKPVARSLRAGAHHEGLFMLASSPGFG